MTEELKKTIKEEITQLPKEGQDAIGAVDWVKITEAIGKKFLLGEDEIDAFQLETLLVLTGTVDPQFYAVNIENHVERTNDESVKMAEEAFEKIFTPIRNTLEENIKQNLKTKTPNWQQNVEFILSGGDYFTFMAPVSDTADVEENTNTLIGHRTMQDMKSKLLN